MNQRPDSTATKTLVSDDGEDVMGRVFRSAKDLADLLVAYRRVQSRLQKYE